MKSKIGLGLILLAGIALTVAYAQGPPHPPQPPHTDPLAQFIFPPELVMQHQREIGLTGEQKTFLRAEIQRVTTRFNELQWQLQDAMEGLQGIMKESSVNQQQALAQLERILDTEREIKRLHMELAIQIKNKLTPEQQSRLQELKRERHFAPAPRPPNP
ncbi:MAG TPA: periplasmic heavy metal sensor [Pyrinomonadaceae bacterium]|nr:periplasmic heavy metal sensor [Pyrinomonadaceae bacterium]